MRIQKRIAYWITGEWILDLLLGNDRNTKRQNCRQNAKTTNANDLVVECTSNGFCGHMRTNPKGIFCAKELYGVPVRCPWAANPKN